MADGSLYHPRIETHPRRFTSSCAFRFKNIKLVILWRFVSWFQQRFERLQSRSYTFLGCQT